VKGTSLAGDPEGYVQRSVDMGIFSHRGPILGNLGEGSSTGDFEMDEGSQWMNCLPFSLKRLHGGGLGRSSFNGDTRRYVWRVARRGHHSLRGTPAWGGGGLVCR
jgi:hypothetical protein